MNFAKERYLECWQDEKGNFYAKIPANGECSDEAVIIQGHMDMVYVRTEDCPFTYEEGIEVLEDENYLYANGTSLGADNGIAVAYAMAILASKDIPHPPIEVLITTDEETGMSGAMAINKEHIDGKILINLDNEEEGYLLVSCAGGIRSTATINIEKQDIKDKKLVKINISGLKGGHSGMDIIKERGNSNKILGRVLKGLSREVKFNLVNLNGGSKNNAIPREAEAIISINASDENTVINVIKNWNDIIGNELRTQDPGLKI